MAEQAVGGDARVPIMAAIDAALAGGAPVAVATVVASGELPGTAVGAKLLVQADGSGLGTIDGGPVDALVVAAAQQLFALLPRVDVQTLYVHAGGGSSTRRSQARPGDAELMLQLFESPARLVIVGGGHVGLAIAQVAELAHFDVTVIDDREEFANRERFTMADEVRCGPVDRELDAVRVDAQTSIVLVSRGHQVDELALRHALGRGAAYLGMIGSRRRTATVLSHLAEEGLPQAELDRVHTPIGLDIGAETPEEIAVAIVGELILARRGGSGRPLSALPNRRAAERL